MKRLKKLNWIMETDPKRKFAITYIDGEIYTGYTHHDCVNEYLLNNNLDNEDNLKIAFAYMYDDGNIYLSTDYMWNINKNEINNIAQVIKEKYPNNNILEDMVDYDIDEHKKIASKRLKKTADNMNIIPLQSGDIIQFSYRMVNNKPWYQICQESPFSSFSYYDGPDLEEAQQIYQDLLTVFQGVGAAEAFGKDKKLKDSIEKYIVDEKYQNEMFQRLKKDPLFLGIPRNDMV